MNKKILTEILFYKPLNFKNDLVHISLLDFNFTREISKVCFDENLWKFTPTKLINDEDVINYVNKSLLEYRDEKSIPFVIFDSHSGKLIGSTKCQAISLVNLRMEIGNTWIIKEYQNKGYNKSVKFELLKFFFEELKFKRIEFKTDLRNLPSRNALKAIGAVEEGILRNHLKTDDNYWRDSVYYSILSDEWIETKNKFFTSYL
ncbi:MAG TPA: GNAT family protein [Ignavibacteria bacterium]|nr:GNAT family protein [Ignavibacteria bacterium]